MNEIILKIEDAEKRYATDKGEELLAISGINLTLSKNSFLSLVGPSGCGKSTLLRTIAGLETLTSGAIYYQSTLLRGYQPGISIVFQDYSLFPWRNVLDNVTVGLEFAKMGRKEREETGMNYLKLVGLERFSKAYPHELSGGMRQRVAMVRSLVNDPNLLLMDEPFGALDAHTRIILQNELLRIWEQDKKTIVFVTHSVDEAVYLSDQIVVLTRLPGRIKEVVQIDMPRPRDRANPEYAKLVARLIDMLGEEVSALP
jgi:ABC-type nitrate/sulfonate/bicarbonate transport system ATPase subunit